MCCARKPYIDVANSLSFVPVRLGMRSIGSLGISGTVLTRQTLEAIGTLTAVAIERARAVEQLGQTEAARESEQPANRPTRCGDACPENATHFDQGIRDEFALQSKRQRRAAEELLTIVNEETDRLNRLVGEAAEMARLDAGEVELNLAPHSIYRGCGHCAGTR